MNASSPAMGGAQNISSAQCPICVLTSALVAVDED
jgi:hypothetical protein